MREPQTQFTPAAALPARAEVAPPSPVEQHIVGALAVERLRSHVTSLLFMLQASPRATAAVGAQFRLAQAEMNKAWENYTAYEAVRSCEGQA